MKRTLFSQQSEWNSILYLINNIICAMPYLMCSTSALYINFKSFSPTFTHDAVQSFPFISSNFLINKLCGVNERDGSSVESEIFSFVFLLSSISYNFIFQSTTKKCHVKWNKICHFVLLYGSHSGACIWLVGTCAISKIMYTPSASK